MLINSLSYLFVVDILAHDLINLQISVSIGQY